MHSRKTIIMILLLLYPLGLFGMGTDTVQESAGRGYIDWSRGYVEATGIGKKKGRAPDGNGDEALLERARRNAAEHLLETLRHVRIDAVTTVGAFLAADPLFRERVEKMVAAAPMADRRAREDGAVAVTLRMTFFGGFAQFVLPQEIRQVENVRRLTPEVSPSLTESTTDTQESMSKKPEEFTGLVVDAKGLGVAPAMAPVIYDENGREVFGPTFISREYAVQNGVSGYGRVLSAAMAHDRVAGNPLLVKGLYIKGPGSSDIVISNTDAAKVRSASHNLSFLRKCQVMIVLD